eukprot:278405_1
MHYLHRFRNLSQIRSIQYHHLSTIPIDMMTNTLSKATLQSYVTYLYHFIRNFLFFLTFFKDIILLKMNMGGLFGDYGASGDLGGVDTGHEYVIYSYNNNSSEYIIKYEHIWINCNILSDKYFINNALAVLG